MNQKELYNNFFKKYGKGIHSDPLRFIAISDLCKGRVLDIGCGTGDLADFYKDDYLGIDISDVAIELAKEDKRRMANFEVGDIEKSYKPDYRVYDTIVLAEFLEHVKDDKIIFDEIKKWAIPGTRIIITVPNGDRVPDPNHVREFTIPQLRKRFSELGLVKFYNWAGAKDRILMTIDLGKKNENLLSLAMIVKDEEWGLERAVLSCIEFVDNIVISVDCFSNDNTLEIAKLYADTLKRHEWKDDFAAARNFAEEGIKTKWIFVLDGHEYVKEYKSIDEMLELDIEGLFTQVEMDGKDRFYVNRFHRSGLQWTGAIHNVIRTKTNKKVKGILIKHDRNKGQSKKSALKRWEQRNEMMPRLLKKEMRKDKTKGRAVWYLARWYFTSKKFKKAIRYYKKYLKKKGVKGERWYACLESSLCAMGLGKPLLALKFLRLAEKEIPNRWETSKRMAAAYLSFEQWEKAIEWFVDSLKVNTGDFSYNPEERDDAGTWDLIGYCWFQLKKYKKAIVSWERAIELEKDEDKIKLNKKRIELIERKLIL